MPSPPTLCSLSSCISCGWADFLKSIPGVDQASERDAESACALLPFLDQLLWVNWFPEIYHCRRSGEWGLWSLIFPFPPFPAAFLIGRLLSWNLRKLVDDFRSLETVGDQLTYLLKVWIGQLGWVAVIGYRCANKAGMGASQRKRPRQAPIEGKKARVIRGGWELPSVFFPLLFFFLAKLISPKCEFFFN
jgi:hypothetical protein